MIVRYQNGMIPRKARVKETNCTFSNRSPPIQCWISFRMPIDEFFYKWTKDVICVVKAKNSSPAHKLNVPVNIDSGGGVRKCQNEGEYCTFPEDYRDFTKKSFKVCQHLCHTDCTQQCTRQCTSELLGCKPAVH